MLKLHKLSLYSKRYWKTWETQQGSRLVQWGDLGTFGSTKVIRKTLFQSKEKKLRHEIDGIRAQGFLEVPPEDYAIMMLRLPLVGIEPGTEQEKNYRLQNRMAQTLDWVGLGTCDGGIIGRDFLEVCCFVVDFEVGKSVIEADLSDTEFADCLRIYDASICRRLAH